MFHEELTVQSKAFLLEERKGTLFLFLAYSGLVYAASREKTKKKHTEHERCSFWVPLKTRGCLTRTTHGKKHTLNTRGCSFEYH